MENTNKSGEVVSKEVKSPKENGVFTLAEYAMEFFDVIKAANPRLDDKIKPDVIKLFKTYDALNAQKAKVTSVIVDGIVYDINEYQIPDILKEYIAPRYVTMTGRDNSPELVLRSKNTNVVLDPAEANKIVVALCRYLRIPVSAFERPQGIGFMSIPEEKLGIGNYYNSEEFGYNEIRYLINPKAIVPSQIWDEVYIESNLIKKMGKHLVNRFTTEMVNASKGGQPTRQSTPTPPVQITQPGHGEPLNQ